MKTKSASCDPNEVAVKSLFLGPAAENAEWLESTLNEIFQNWYAWRRQINAKDSSIISADDQALPEFKAQQDHTHKTIQNLLGRFEDEIPKFSPRYIGHMFSEISMPALLGHFIALLHNPNNISPEASKVGTEIESEAVDLLKQIVGYKKGFGHFTSGGTVANFEFLFRARERLAMWQATAIAAGVKDPILTANIGWKQFDEIKDRVSPEEIAKYYVLDNRREAVANIQKEVGINTSEPVLLVPWSKHYSWPKAMHYLGLGESNIRYLELDRFGRASSESLKNEIQLAILRKEPILGVVGIVGTTEMGTIDPINKFATVIDEFKKKEGLNIWLHIDGAYGGFFRSLVGNSDENQFMPDSVQSSLRAIAFSDSITLDPHKLGYVPYSSGAFVCQNDRDYFIRSFTGPYIVSDDKNIGNYTLEGSRSAAGAVATHASIRSFDSIHGYSKVLRRTIVSKNEFQKGLMDLKVKVFIPESLDTNILCFIPVGRTQFLSELNEQSLRLYDQIHSSEEYWISKTTLSLAAFRELIKNFCNAYQIQQDCDCLVLLRLTLMNPFTVSKESAVDHVATFCTLLEKKFSELEEIQSRKKARKFSHRD